MCPLHHQSVIIPQTYSSLIKDSILCSSSIIFLDSFISFFFYYLFHLLPSLTLITHQLFVVIVVVVLIFEILPTNFYPFHYSYYHTSTSFQHLLTHFLPFQYHPYYHQYACLLTFRIYSCIYGYSMLHKIKKPCKFKIIKMN